MNVNHVRPRILTGSRRLLAGVAVIALTAGLSACGGDDDDDAASTPDTTAATTDDTTTDETGAEMTDQFPEYIGLEEADAGAQADEAGLTWRVISRDGEDLAVTMDYNPDRVNFAIEEGVVVAATAG